MTGLKSYDAVVIEVDLTQQLLDQCKQINVLLEQQLSTKDNMIENLMNQIKTYKDQVGIQDIQMKKLKRKGFFTTFGGIVLAIGALLIK